MNEAIKKWVSVPRIMKCKKKVELIRAYRDLEKTLAKLNNKSRRLKYMDPMLHQINLKKLVIQLTLSKRRLEAKLSNSILLEKQKLKRKISAVTQYIKT